jgi:transcriptional regulator with XRE-family HTH domain
MNFRELREAAGIPSQSKLAALSGVEQTTIGQLERGQVKDPRWSTIAALATALGVGPGVVAAAIASTPKARRIA